MKHIFVIIAFISLSGCHKSSVEKTKPNILLIMADDIGYSDIGCFGGEIATPNIDRMAKEGLRMTNFYNMAKCNPTRSSLLTGLYKGGKGAVHLAHITKNAGYFNIMSGKEHFDKWVPDYCKAENVFDHSFYFWATTEYFLPPSGAFERPFFLEGKKIDAKEIYHEISPMYKTDFITDYALKWLEEGFKRNKPFFLYLPYHVAHYPLQARPEDIEKYRGKYLEGWDRLRTSRFERMKSMGIVPENTELSQPEGSLNKLRGPLIASYTNYFPWDSLNDVQKDSMDLEMGVYAAMIDRMDQNIGRVLQKLEKEGELDNTIVMFLIDNGACPFYSNKIPEILPGPADSYWSMRAAWGHLCNTPYRQFKQTGFKGGSLTPFIVRWPGNIPANSIDNQPGHVVDMLPTFLDITKIEYPDSIHGFPTLPVHGSSLMPVFKGKKRDNPQFMISGLEAHRMFMKGDFKIIRMNNEEWELYNIKDDPSETRNLASEYPDKLDEMIRFYESSGI